MRKLATVQTVAAVEPIPGADAIEKVQVRGWWCVAKKGEFTVGAPCVYFEIDSLLPDANPAFEFLAKGGSKKTMHVDGIPHTGYRLKTIKLRGQLSQGLALPLATLGLDPAQYPVDSDVSLQLGVVKYEAPIPAELAGKVKGSFPGFIPKTDEERVQNMPEVIAKHAAAGTLFYVTEKLDGTSATFYRHTTNADGDHFGVCSRNLELLETEGNTHWRMARKYNLAALLPNGFAVQGEIMGPGIQGNPLRLTEHEFYAYQVYDIFAREYLPFGRFTEICKHWGLKTVPVIGVGEKLPTPDGTLTMDALIAAADGNSALTPIDMPAPREGVVWRPITEATELINGNTARFSFKVISNAYLLAEK